MRMRHFGLKWPICSNEYFFKENLLKSLVPFIHAYLHAKNQGQILMNKEYWNLTAQEPFLALTWEPDFSQARSFLAEC